VEGIWLACPEEPARGTPVAIKDLLDTAGLVTTYGSALFAEHVPGKSAVAVTRLEQAGYAVAGKTNLHEFAYGISSQNPHFGTVPNPRHPGRLAGGSSGGSAAAVAAGEVELALGTDSGGSIRIPAAWCGVVGFKPTWGLVPEDGCFPLAPSYDHVGPIASTVAGCTDLMRALAPELAAVELESLGELRVGFAWLERADPLVRARVEAVLAFLPHRRPVDLPLNDPAEYRLFMREVADVHRELYAENAELYGDELATKLERCLEVVDAEVALAQRARNEYQERCADLLESFDLVVTPTLSCVAPPVGIGDLALRGTLVRNTLPFNTLGWPALALPCGPAEDGLPASVQLSGRPGADALVLAAGERLANALSAT